MIEFNLKRWWNLWIVFTNLEWKNLSVKGIWRSFRPIYFYLLWLCHAACSPTELIAFSHKNYFSLFPYLASSFTESSELGRLVSVLIPFPFPLFRWGFKSCLFCFLNISQRSCHLCIPTLCLKSRSSLFLVCIMWSSPNCSILYYFQNYIRKS